MASVWIEGTLSCVHIMISPVWLVQSSNVMTNNTRLVECFDSLHHQEDAVSNTVSGRRTYVGLHMVLVVADNAMPEGPLHNRRKIKQKINTGCRV